MVVVVVQVVEGAATVDVAIENNKKEKTKKKGKKNCARVGCVYHRLVGVCVTFENSLASRTAIGSPPEKRVRWVEQKGKSDEEKMR